MGDLSGERTCAQAPEVGTVLDTIYGRARVMDVLRLGDEPETVCLRPERGGLEWTVTTTQLPSVLMPVRS
ncbi:hypothetical protein [Yinghuangia sp. YIM S09857]|uniref:hypothetical protein n=1 Tax=Yinghuangia sp. YIM S09857 TaxID=3436929 RepID=UPI003F52A66A